MKREPKKLCGVSADLPWLIGCWGIGAVCVPVRCCICCWRRLHCHRSVVLQQVLRGKDKSHYFSDFLSGCKSIAFVFRLLFYQEEMLALFSKEHLSPLIKQTVRTLQHCVPLVHCLSCSKCFGIFLPVCWFIFLHLSPCSKCACKASAQVPQASFFNKGNDKTMDHLGTRTEYIQHVTN